MREKYESLQLAQLKELAKARGLKSVSAMRKPQLIELMLEEDERDKQKAASAAPAEKSAESVDALAPEQKPAAERQSYERPAGERPSYERNTERQGTDRYPARSGADRAGGDRYGNDRSNWRPGGERTAARAGGEYPRRHDSRISYVRGESQSRAESGYGNYSNYSNNSGTYGANGYNNVSEPAAGYTAGSTAGAPFGDSVENAERQQRAYRPQETYEEGQFPKELDSGQEACGILEVMSDGFGFIRSENYMPGDNDVYVAPSQIRRFGLKTGDILRGNKRIKTQQEKFSALLYVRSVNGYAPEEASRRPNFEDMTPIFPNERIRMETPGCSVAMRVMDLVSPVGKGQRGMIVSPPKAGKTTLLKDVAKSILCSNPKMNMLILLIDERPEEVTDIKEAIHGENVEVIYSTFDELAEHHKRVSEMVIERAKRLVEHKKDVVILIDSITRLTRAYNQVVPPSGRTLSGGLDPSALHMPKRFFGAARNMREGGSLTILATALVDTGSKMDDVVYEEFKGTGNMEMILDRKLSEKRIFPAIDIAKSGTRREDLLLNEEELEAINIMRKALNGLKPDEAADKILEMFSRTRNNREFVSLVKKNRFI